MSDTLHFEIREDVKKEILAREEEMRELIQRNRDVCEQLRSACKDKGAYDACYYYVKFCGA